MKTINQIKDIKNNNKNRKLKKIRQKNNFRLFKTDVIASAKISENIFKNDEKEVERLINIMCKEELLRVEKKYKAKCEIKNTAIGFLTDDFCRDTITLKIKIAKYKHSILN